MVWKSFGHGRVRVRVCFFLCYDGHVCSFCGVITVCTLAGLADVGTLGGATVG
jgi:hypothetical protein